ncbi:uncharacterized protein SAPINGB_P000938 [Magnusiomyces paraingens]|uniref:Major facilitator superfamily (MFS) profile domain-containing protein n=1 Tax=Magnusiomyces paraingens TaxID=2606893 RepID=A0A5E8B4X5_9ASCO|nr:uncharacterized protein SAPINGB_P000938 [Saprochaete ingens]VVT45882.1 unnamed protein product [Saprochaete ingens]
MRIISVIKGFIPHYRDIDEDFFINQEHSTIETISQTDQSETVVTSKETWKINEQEQTEAQKEIQYEIRDEASRKWWSMFNEYEYKPKEESRSNNKWYHWFNESDSVKERRLIMKLDLILCLFSFTMYWVKYLDQSNINNAYVSGMKEDLKMKGNDLINTTSLYTVGTILFQIPMMFLIHRYPTHIILPIMDLGWGFFTLALYRSNTLGQLKGYRFFVGVFESAFYPTIHYLLGSWYKPSEYARRAGVFYFGKMLGLCTAGLIMSSCVRLDGVHGIAGWRWMFIIDAIITMPIAIIGFFVIPGTPHKCYSIILTDEDIFIARKRLKDANISIESEGPKFFSVGLWKKMFTNWKWYMFVLLNILVANCSNTSSGSFILWLKSLNKYSVSKLNELSSVTPALGIVWIFLVTSFSDQFRSRWGAIFISQFFNFFCNILLAIWDIPYSLKWFAFCLQCFGWAASSVLYSWAADAMRHDPQERAITVVTMSLIGSASSAGLNVLVWKTSEAPRFFKGYVFTCAVAVSMVIVATIILPLYKKDERKHATENGILLYNSAKGEVPPTLPN